MTQLPVANLDWRTQLRACLVAHADAPVSVRSLWAQFGVAMPLMHATRIWLDDHVRLALTDTPMRWRAFTVELRKYALRCEPPIGRGRPWTLDHVVTPITRICPACAGRYVAQARTRTCSLSCAAKHWRAKKRAAALKEAA